MYPLYGDVLFIEMSTLWGVRFIERDSTVFLCINEYVFCGFSREIMTCISIERRAELLVIDTS